MKPKKLKPYQWKEPPFKCRHNINEYWEYIKLIVLGRTDKLCIVTGDKK